MSFCTDLATAVSGLAHAVADTVGDTAQAASHVGDIVTDLPPRSDRMARLADLVDGAAHLGADLVGDASQTAAAAADALGAACEGELTGLIGLLGRDLPPGIARLAKG